MLKLKNLSTFYWLFIKNYRFIIFSRPNSKTHLIKYQPNSNKFNSLLKLVYLSIFIMIPPPMDPKEFFNIKYTSLIILQKFSLNSHQKTIIVNQKEPRFQAHSQPNNQKPCTKNILNLQSHLFHFNAKYFERCHKLKTQPKVQNLAINYRIERQKGHNLKKRIKTKIFKTKNGPTKYRPKRKLLPRIRSQNKNTNFWVLLQKDKAIAKAIEKISSKSLRKWAAIQS